MPANKHQTGPRKHVVIAGGGFAGIVAARQLSRHKGLKVTLITDSHYFRYCPALYRVATGYLRRQAIIPMTELLPNEHNIELVIDSVVRINRKKHEIRTKGKRLLHYDYTILALGVVTSYFGIKGLEKYSYGIKSIEAITQLHDHLHQQLTKTHNTDTNYVIVGGGPTGVELAAGLGNYLKQIAKYHGIAEPHIKLELIEAAPRLLPTFSEKTSALALKRLKKLGVTVMVGSKVEAETSKSLSVSGRSIPTSTVVWTAGVTNHPFYKTNGRQFELSPRGKVIVNQFLQVDEHTYVVGDNAETKFSGLAEVAVHQGHYAAHEILFQMADLPTKPYEVSQPTYVLPVGANWAVMQWKGRSYGGHWVSYVRKMADLIGYADVMGWRGAFKLWLRDEEAQESCPICAGKSK